MLAIMSKAHAAILTGDLISSRKTSPDAVDAALATLADSARTFGDRWLQDTRFTRHRGDGWQIVLQDPGLALRAMLYLAARLRASGASCDTRVSIGVGAIDSQGTRDLSDGFGEAFHMSGDGLETSGKRRLTIAGSGIGPWQELTVELVDAISEDWTVAQAEAAAFALLSDPTQEDIAAELGISRQAVQLRLAGAKMRAIEDAVDQFQHHWSDA
jgi:hypothetical protein